MNEQSESQYRSRTVVVDIAMLENATIVYDQVTDTLHISLSKEEAEEVILLENGVIVKIRDGKLVGLSVQGISRYS
ncbi:MAG: DUF2283 domain-containing protein [Desulfurococcaceae archaeon]|jgi:uncharacterized protein YuzE|nr:DUF2283 domain-containing protein [Desulfurococcaceae archaeon]